MYDAWYRVRSAQFELSAVAYVRIGKKCPLSLTLKSIWSVQSRVHSIFLVTYQYCVFLIFVGMSLKSDSGAF